jgi:hypothetical protein
VQLMITIKILNKMMINPNEKVMQEEQLGLFW